MIQHRRAKLPVLLASTTGLGDELLEGFSRDLQRFTCHNDFEVSGSRRSACNLAVPSFNGSGCVIIPEQQCLSGLHKIHNLRVCQQCSSGDMRCHMSSNL